MTHYVLIKFKPGTDLDAAYARVASTYAALDAALTYLHDATVYRCCVERDSNADVMAVIHLDGAEHLQPYLTHPLHMAMAMDLKESIASKISFDHN